MRPDWLRGDDPWLTARMRQVAQRAAAEDEIGRGVILAISRFLRIAAAAVLGEPTPTFATADDAAQESAAPPNLDAWPGEQVWLELLAAHVLPRVGGVFDDLFAAQAVGDDSRWKFAYLEEVNDRLKIWPEGAFEDIRFELLEGLQQGETVAQLRARVGRSLNIDARSRAAQAQINYLTGIIDDPQSTQAQKAAARAERKGLYASQDVADAEWQWKAARIARTEAMGAMNGGTYAGARQHEINTGETRFKQWWSTTDNRTRDSHWAAHMQVQPLSEPFSVGGFSLQHPGQAGGPAHEVINCRCLLLIMTPEQAAVEQARYEALRPDRTTINGQPMDDAGQPIAVGLSTAARRVLGLTDVRLGQFSVLTTSPGWCSAPEQKRKFDMAQPIPLPPGDNPIEPDDWHDDDGPPLPVGWMGILAPVNTPSADWRMLMLADGQDPQTRPLPLPLKYQDKQWGAHDGAVGIGLITKVWRDGEAMWGSGPFDLDDERAACVARKVADGYQGWVSVDLDPPRVAEYVWYGPDNKPIPGPADNGVEVEAYPQWRLSSATIVMDPAFPEAKIQPVYDASLIVMPETVVPPVIPVIAPAAGGAVEGFTVIGDTSLPWAPRPTPWDGAAAAARVADWAGGTGTLDAAKYARAFLYRNADGDPAAVGSYKLGFADIIGGELRAVWDGVVACNGALNGARAPLDVPASDVDGLRSKVDTLYASAAKAFNDPTIVPPGKRTAALVAAGGPLAAPADWFMYPGFSGPTGWTVMPDGRVFGHAGLFEGVEGATPHIGWLMSGRRLFAPRETVYDRHNRKPYRVAEGYDIGVGLVVIDTNHADTNPWVTAGEAMDHYANTGSRVAFVRAGSDQWGTWLAGTLVPGLTAEQVVHTRTLSLSGDWREIDGKVEFICGLGVNVEALHVPRQVTGEDGRILALTAACPVPPSSGQVWRQSSEPVDPAAGRMVLPDPQAFARALVLEQDAHRRREADAMALYMRIVGPELDKLAKRIKGLR